MSAHAQTRTYSNSDVFYYHEYKTLQQLVNISIILHNKKFSTFYVILLCGINQCKIILKILINVVVVQETLLFTIFLIYKFKN